MEPARTPAAGKTPSAKRARINFVEAQDDDKIVALSTLPGVLDSCPETVDVEDFSALARLKDAYGGNKHFRILPMPAAAYTALGVVPPGIASMAEVAQNCFSKTSRERYTSNEIEVRDLRLTHTSADFPAFYEGPAHPHMLPEGGARVIAHAPAAASTADDEDTVMGATLIPACVSGISHSHYTNAFDDGSASAGAGAF
jgi:hypothetical protein